MVLRHVHKLNKRGFGAVIRVYICAIAASTVIAWIVDSGRASRWIPGAALIISIFALTPESRRSRFFEKLTGRLVRAFAAGVLTVLAILTVVAFSVDDSIDITENFTPSNRQNVPAAPTSGAPEIRTKFTIKSTPRRSTIDVTIRAEDSPGSLVECSRRLTLHISQEYGSTVNRIGSFSNNEVARIKTLKSGAGFSISVYYTNPDPVASSCQEDISIVSAIAH